MNTLSLCVVLLSLCVTLSASQFSNLFQKAAADEYREMNDQRRRELVNEEIRRSLGEEDEMVGRNLDEVKEIGRSLEEEMLGRSLEEEEEMDVRDLIETAAAEQAVYRRGTFDCSQRGGSCRGVVPCCGTLQCYWREGYSIRTTGVCVDCVSRSQKCQRDTQCCSPLVCQKGARTHVDGTCDEKRQNGAECHEDDQCLSANCETNWQQKIKGYGGACRPRSG